MQWFNNLYTDNAINALANGWEADVIRLSLYANEGGYADGNATQRRQWRDRIDQLISIASNYGLYVIIDWHMLNPGDPNLNIDAAVEFFTYMAQRHGNKKNVIFEICNEPNDHGVDYEVTWDNHIKPYADSLISVIRRNEPGNHKNIIIVGTPTWASSPNDVIGNEVNAPENVMYTMHFYAASHLATGEYMDKMMQAVHAGLPIFVSEFGTQGYCGGDPGTDRWANDFTSSQMWLDTLAKYKISWCNWNYSTDVRSGAVFRPGTVNGWSPVSAFSDPSNLKEAGLWIMDQIKNRVPQNRELVRNGNFTAGSTNWEFHNWGSGSGRGSVINGSYHFETTISGTNIYDNTLRQMPFTLRNGRLYHFSFDARGNGSKALHSFIMAPTEPYQVYNSIQVVPGTTTSRYSQVFVMEDATDANVSLQFQSGIGAGTIVLDNVSIMELVDSALFITSPAGGEEYRAGDTINISWLSTPDIEQVDLFYSRDGGNWIPIETAVANSGSYTWRAPAILSDNIRIRVAARNVSGVSDITAGSISIVEGGKQVPEILVNPVASSIVYGQTLSQSLLSGGQASVSGAFSFADDTKVLDAGTINAEVVFTPEDEENWTSITFTVTVEVQRRGLEIIAGEGTKTYGDEDPELAYTLNGELVGQDSIVGNLTREAGEDVGTYAITVGNLSAGDNYLLTFVGNTFTVNPRPLTVKADSQSMAYGDEEPELTFDIINGSLVDGDSFSGSLQRVAGLDVGIYSISQGSLSAGINYEILFIGDTLRIIPKEITVKADPKRKVIGENDPELTYQVTDGNLIGDDSFSGSLSREEGEEIGVYLITQGDLSAGSNYNLTFVADTFRITQMVITVRAEESSKIYGDDDPVFTFNFEPNTIDGSVFSGSLSREPGENVGIYTITLGSLSAGDTYEIEYIENTFTISPKPITITANSQSKVFGNDDPDFTFSVTAGELIVDDNITGTLTRDTGENVGSYALRIGTISAGDNYDISLENALLTINPRPISVRANAGTKMFGENDPPLTFAITQGSLVGYDTFSGTLSRTPGEEVGMYTITLGSLTAGDNYLINFESDVFRIVRNASRELVRNGDFSNGSQYWNFYNWGSGSGRGSVVNETYHFETTIAGSNIWDNTLRQMPFTLHNGYLYRLSYDARGDGTKPLYAYVMMPDDPYDVYFSNQIIPATTFSRYSEVFMMEGPTDNSASLQFQSGIAVGTIFLDNVSLQEITDSAIFINAPIAGSIYQYQDPITIEWLSTPDIENVTIYYSLDSETWITIAEGIANDRSYTWNAPAISSNTVSFKVSAHNMPGVIDITAGTVTIEYEGKHIPEIIDAPFVSPIVYGQTLNQSVLSGGQASTPGNFYFTDTSTVYGAGNASVEVEFIPTDEDNWERITFTVSIEVLRKELNITATESSKVYGDQDPAFDYTITSGSLIGEDEISGALSREPGENAGTYSILIGDLSAGNNYNISFTPNTFTITPRAITVKADSQSKEYGDSDPQLSFDIISGSLLSGDSFTGTLVRESGEDVGEYLITLGDLSASDNYSLTFIGDTLTITPRAVTVKADSQSKEYGDSDPQLSFEIISGTLLSGDSFTGTLTRESGEDVGEYLITLGDLRVCDNYSLTFIGDTLIITPRAITVKADSQSKEYGDEDPQLSFDIVSGSFLSDDSFTGTLIRESGEDVGEYLISLGDLSAGDNYSLTFIGDTLTITPRAITVKADPQ
ncbi:Endo-1,4-beta-glucanase, partial [Chitinispirillum alkaliphilum]